MLKANITKKGWERILVHRLIKTIIIPGILFVSFSHFMVELFGQTIPNIFLSYFRGNSDWISCTSCSAVCKMITLDVFDYGLFLRV